MINNMSKFRAVIAGKMNLILLVALTLIPFPFLLSALSVNYFPIQADETALAWAAKQCYLGRTPYRDFFCYWPPLVLYGPALVFKLTVPALAALRIFTVLYIIVITALLYFAYIQLGISRPWAMLFAWLFPLTVFAFWPMPSHHWFVCAPAILALALIFNPHAQRSHWAAAGFFTGITLLTLQPEGMLTALLVFLYGVSALRQKRLTWPSALWTAAGMAFPVILVIFWLWHQDALHATFYHTVTWPIRYYKQPGGFNDLSCTYIWQWVCNYWPAPISWLGLFRFVLVLGALLYPPAALLSLVLAPDWACRPLRLSWRWLESALALLLIIAIYMNGRQAFASLLFYTPYLWISTFKGISWDKEKLRPNIWKSWGALMLTVALGYWLFVFQTNPPRVSDITRVDRYMLSIGTPSLLKRLEIPEGAPVLCLPYGSLIYFYYAPIPPYIDWLQPPSSRCHSPEEYQIFADFAHHNRPAYILVQTKYLSQYLLDPSPVRDLLVTEYERIWTRGGIAVFAPRRAISSDTATEH